MQRPYFNLAAEEYFLKTLDTQAADYVFIYVNSPAVVVGRNQNIYEEVNLHYCLDMQIDVCRRISGGGTVFHDLGNINIAFFKGSKSNNINNYEYFMQDLFRFLESKGINAYLNERNSIFVGNKKIGGNAQFTDRRNIVSHCTLLFDANLNQLEQAIHSPFKQIESRASKSVRSEVINLSQLLKDTTMAQFLEELQIFYQQYSPFQLVVLNENEQTCIKTQYMPKYESFDWIYARSPKCEIYVKNEHFVIENGHVLSSSKDLLKKMKFIPKEELKIYFE